jgi:hypothetical protein
LDELPIAKDDLFETIKEEDGRWVIEYRARGPGGEEIWLGKGVVPLDQRGQPDGSPTFTLDATYHAPDLGTRAVHIYDRVAGKSGPVAGRRGEGGQHALTPYALDRLLALYKRRFGSDVDSLPGRLEWANKLNFQREYYRLTTIEGVPSTDAAVQAAKEISFGKHRVGAGFDDIRVRATGKEVVDLGAPYGKQAVPRRIWIDARRSK